jgi:uncharacterized protein YjbJ (UPF0337 family)
MGGIILKDKLDNEKNKIVGQVKEKIGQITKDEELEFQGKYQYLKSDVGNKLESVKNEMFDKANDLIDKVTKDKKSKKL